MTQKNDIRRESTSIKIDPRIWKQAKIEAIRNDLELSELVEQAIEKWMEDQAQKIAKGSKK